MSKAEGDLGEQAEQHVDDCGVPSHPLLSMSVCFATGCVLIAAGLLKICTLALEPMVPPSNTVVAVLEVQALVFVELFIGSSLLLGAWPRLMRRLAIGLFASFLAFSVYQIVRGAACCDCFGSYRVSPAVAAAIDLAALCALSQIGHFSTCMPHPPRRRIVLPFVVAAAIIGTVPLAPFFARLTASGVDVRPVSLMPASCSDSGDKSVSAVRLRLTNHSSLSVRIFGGNGGCSCVVTRDLPITIEPRASRDIHVLVVRPEMSRKQVVRYAFYSNSGQIAGAFTLLPSL